jgi:hypothetical protein
MDHRRERAEALLGTCSCHEAYKSRGLVDHNCPWCNYAEDLLDYERAAEARVLREFVAWMEWRRWTGTRAIRTLPEYMNEFMQGREEGRE